MFKRHISILFLCLALCFSVSAWADDDTMIDIDNHYASYSGADWNLSGLGTGSGPFFYGDNIAWTACSGAGVTTEITWSSAPTVFLCLLGSPHCEGADISGEYAVYVRWTTDPNRTTAAKYRIYNRVWGIMGSSTQIGSCTRNQQVFGGEWIYCDTVNVDRTNGSILQVRLGNDCEAGKYVVGDAVRFVRVSKDKDDIVDMPGVDYEGGDQEIILNMAGAVIRSLTVVAPSPGHVIVNASAYLNFTTTGPDLARCTITTGGGLDSNYLSNIGDKGDSLSYASYSATRGFAVSAGSTTFNLFCDLFSGGVTLRDSNLTAIFSPTKY